MDHTNKATTQQDPNKIAILFDAENISYKYVDEAVALAKQHGNPIIRAYADFSNTSVKGWEEPALKYGIRTIHQYSYDKKNNSSDFLMMHDAFKLMYSGKISVFFIITNDSDFITPIQLLRQSGAHVHGVGVEDKCSDLLVAACNTFTFLRNSTVAKAVVQEQKEQPNSKSPMVPKNIVNKLISTYQQLKKPESVWVDMGQFCAQSNISNTHYKKFSTLLINSGRFELTDRKTMAKLTV